MSDIPLSHSAAFTQRELGCKAGSLTDREPAARECAIYIAVWFICLYGKVYEQFSLELEPQLSVALVTQSNQTAQYFRNAVFLRTLSFIGKHIFDN